MGPLLGVITAVAGVASVVNTAKAAKAAGRSADIQANMAKEQQKQQDLSYQRQQRQAIREAQIRRAQGVSSAQGFGVGSTSLAYGGVSSIASQTGSALGYGSQMSGLSSNIVNMGIAANAANADSARYTSMAGVAGSAFNFLGGPQKFRNMLGL